MSTGYSSKTWMCPYFRYDGKLEVRCECSKMTFPDRKTYDQFVEKHCANVKGWKSCNLAACLTDYHERKECCGEKCRQNQATRA